MSYNLKPALTIEELISLMKDRGMQIDDEVEAARVLGQVNYYRINGFAFLFQKPNDKYSKGTSFQHIIRLMEFDAELRHLLMKHLELIEIYARTQISHWFSLAHNRDGGAHYDPSLFVNPIFHEEYLQNLEAQIEKNKDQAFVHHHIQSFGGKMPLWSAVEILSFSMLSKLYSNMLPDDKELIAANMNTDSGHLTNWLHCFSVLRNACAHYSRLYQNTCSPKVSLDAPFMRKYPEVYQDTLFAYIVAMLRILPDEIKKSFMVTSLSSLFDRYTDAINMNAIGFPENWNEILSDKKNTTLKPVSEEKRTLKLLLNTDI